MNQTPNDRDSPGSAPQTPDPLGHDTPFLVILIVLAVVVVVLWFADPSHRPHGQSRVDWPGQNEVKP